MTTTDPGGGTINWSNEDDPITGAVRQAGQSLASTAERTFQFGYMLQIMRTQRAQDQLAAHNNPDHEIAIDQTIRQGDTVLAYDRDNIGTVQSVHNDTAHVRFVNAETGASKTVPLPVANLQRLDPRQSSKPPPSGQLDPATEAEVVEAPEPGNPNQGHKPGSDRPTNRDQGNKPESGRAARPEGGDRGTMDEVDRPVQVGDRVRAHDRGNIGRVLSIDTDGDTAEVRFTNTETGHSKDVPLPTARLERLPPKQPDQGSGLLRPGSRPDPKRIQRARTRPRGTTPPNKPGQQPRRQLRRPPKPPT